MQNLNILTAKKYLLIFASQLDFFSAFAHCTYNVLYIGNTSYMYAEIQKRFNSIDPKKFILKVAPSHKKFVHLEKCHNLSEQSGHHLAHCQLHLIVNAEMQKGHFKSQKC